MQVLLNEKWIPKIVFLWKAALWFIILQKQNSFGFFRSNLVCFSWKIRCLCLLINTCLCRLYLFLFLEYLNHTYIKVWQGLLIFIYYNTRCFNDLKIKHKKNKKKGSFCLEQWNKQMYICSRLQNEIKVKLLSPQRSLNFY